MAQPPTPDRATLSRLAKGRRRSRDGKFRTESAAPGALLDTGNASGGMVLTGTLGKKGKQPASERLVKLQGLIKDVFAKDGWKSLMAVRELRRNYSPTNSMLILHGYRGRGVTPTVCMSKSAWEKAGRTIKPGARGVEIFVPRQVNVREENEEGEMEVTGKRIAFKYGGNARVFDVSDTEGPPILGVTEGCANIGGTAEAAATMFSDLGQIAEGMGYEVVEEPLSAVDPGMGGYIDFEKNRIVLNSDKSPIERAHTLAHELGHANDKQLADNPERYQEQRADAEFVAEATAWDICHRYGLDSDEHSAEYVATWQFSKYNPERVKLAKNVLERWWQASQNLTSKLDELQAVPVAA